MESKMESYLHATMYWVAFSINHITNAIQSWVMILSNTFQPLLHTLSWVTNRWVLIFFCHWCPFLSISRFSLPCTFISFHSFSLLGQSLVTLMSKLYGRMRWCIQSCLVDLKTLDPYVTHNVVTIAWCRIEGKTWIGSLDTSAMILNWRMWETEIL